MRKSILIVLAILVNIVTIYLSGNFTDSSFVIGLLLLAVVVGVLSYGYLKLPEISNKVFKIFRKNVEKKDKLSPEPESLFLTSDIENHLGQLDVDIKIFRDSTIPNNYARFLSKYLSDIERVDSDYSLIGTSLSEDILEYEIITFLTNKNNVDYLKEVIRSSEYFRDYYDVATVDNEFVSAQDFVLNDAFAYSTKVIQLSNLMKKLYREYSEGKARNNYSTTKNCYSYVLKRRDLVAENRHVITNALQRMQGL